MTARRDWRGALAAALAAAPAWRWMLALLVCVVGWLALTPTPPHGLQSGWDKVGHGLAFMALGLCAVLAARGHASVERWLLVAMVGYGGAIELLQRQVPGRQAEFGDLMADLVGVAVGALLAGALRRAASARGSARSR